MNLKLEQAKNVITWLMNQGILDILESDVQEIAEQYAGVSKSNRNNDSKFCVKAAYYENGVCQQSKANSYIEAIFIFEKFTSIPYKFTEVWIEDSEGDKKASWNIKDTRPNDKAKNAQFTFDLCKEANRTHLWRGEADANLVKKILFENFFDLYIKDFDVFLDNNKLRGKGSDFWKNAREYYRLRCGKLITDENPITTDFLEDQY